MFTLIRKAFLIPTLALVAMTAVGCASNGKSGTSGSAVLADNSAVSSAHGQAATVFVRTRTGGIESYSTANTPVCQTCMRDAENYFTSGTIDPVCKTCGATRTIIRSNAHTGTN